MANRRKFLAGLGALASGSAAAVGTGAFTSVSAERTVSVNVSSDASAMLALDTTGAANSDYVQTSGDEVNIQLTNSTSYDEGASGVNTNAITRILDLFNIRNQGTQAAKVYVDPESVPPEDRTFGDAGTGLTFDPQASDRPNGEEGDSTLRPNSPNQIRDEISMTGLYAEYTTDFPVGNQYEAGSLVLEPGESFNFGLYINGGDDISDTFSSTVEINALTDIVPDSYDGDSTVGDS